MWDTIEHLRAPEAYIKSISEHMPSDGLLALTTPDIDSLMSRFRKHRWRMIHPPTHAHYFSKKSITSLLDRYGYDVVYIKYCGFYRSVDNVAYILFVLRSKLSWVYKLLKALRIGELGFYTNFYDQMYVIARRR